MYGYFFDTILKDFEKNLKELNMVFICLLTDLNLFKCLVNTNCLENLKVTLQIFLMELICFRLGCKTKRHSLS